MGAFLATWYISAGYYNNNIRSDLYRVQKGCCRDRTGGLLEAAWGCPNQNSVYYGCLCHLTCSIFQMSGELEYLLHADSLWSEVPLTSQHQEDITAAAHPTDSRYNCWICQLHLLEEGKAIPEIYSTTLFYVCLCAQIWFSDTTDGCMRSEEEANRLDSYNYYCTITNSWDAVLLVLLVI